MFTAILPYLDPIDFARYLAGKRTLGRCYVSLDTLVEGLDKVRRLADVPECDIVRRLSDLLYSQKNVFEDPMVPHTALKAVKQGLSIHAAMRPGKAEYLRKRGFGAP